MWNLVKISQALSEKNTFKDNMILYIHVIHVNGPGERADDSHALLQNAPSKDSDQTVQMWRLDWMFARHAWLNVFSDVVAHNDLVSWQTKILLILHECTGWPGSSSPLYEMRALSLYWGSHEVILIIRMNFLDMLLILFNSHSSR